MSSTHAGHVVSVSDISRPWLETPPSKGHQQPAGIWLHGDRVRCDGLGQVKRHAQMVHVCQAHFQQQADSSGVFLWEGLMQVIRHEHWQA